MSDPTDPFFSVIIPTLNEESTIESCLEQARRALGSGSELIVSDGGSRDSTVRLATPHARVVTGPRGRGTQLNAGARASGGAVLVFLHADTFLQPSVGRSIREILRDASVVGGCCRFAVEPVASPAGRYALLELGVNLRTRLFRTATGDQAIFARRHVFERVGGFPELPLFEDVAFVRLLKRQGAFRPIGAVARTSRRRWERHGFWRTVALHWLLRVANRAGVPPRRLARWYGVAESSGSRPE